MGGVYARGGMPASPPELAHMAGLGASIEGGGGRVRASVEPVSGHHCPIAGLLPVACRNQPTFIETDRRYSPLLSMTTTSASIVGGASFMDSWMSVASVMVIVASLEIFSLYSSGATFIIPSFTA